MSTLQFSIFILHFSLFPCHPPLLLFYQYFLPFLRHFHSLSSLSILRFLYPYPHFSFFVTFLPFFAILIPTPPLSFCSSSKRGEKEKLMKRKRRGIDKERRTDDKNDKDGDNKGKETMTIKEER